MIKSKFTFFQVQIKGIFTNTPKLAEPSFCHAPKVLNTINVVEAIGKFVLSMLNSVMLLIAKVNKPIIALKSVCINSRFFIHFLLNNGQQSAYRAVFDYLGIYPAASLDQPENYMLTLGSASSNASNPAGTKVAFIDLYLAAVKGALLLAVISDSLSNTKDYIVNSSSGNTSNFCDFCGFNIRCKQL